MITRATHKSALHTRLPCCKERKRRGATGVCGYQGRDLVADLVAMRGYILFSQCPKSHTRPEAFNATLVASQGESHHNVPCMTLSCTKESLKARSLSEDSLNTCSRPPRALWQGPTITQGLPRFTSCCQPWSKASSVLQPTNSLGKQRCATHWPCSCSMALAAQTSMGTCGRTAPSCLVMPHQHHQRPHHQCRWRRCSRRQHLRLQARQGGQEDDDQQQKRRRIEDELKDPKNFIE